MTEIHTTHITQLPITAHFQFFQSCFHSVIFVPIFPVAQYTVRNIWWLGLLYFPSMTELLVLKHISDSTQNNKNLPQFLMNSYHSLPLPCPTTPTYYSQRLISSHCTFFEPGALWWPLPFRCYFRHISLFTVTPYLYCKAIYLLSHYTIIISFALFPHKLDNY